MVLGVVIGLAAGLAIGLAWHLARAARTAGAARLAEGRLADAQAQSAALAAAAEGGVGGGGGRRDGPRRRRLRARAAPHVRGRGRAPGRRRSATAWPEPSPSCRPRRWRRTTSSSSRWPTPSSTRSARPRQGDLSQRQQAIAQLLDPLSETLARYERGLQDMEVERKGAYARLERAGGRAAPRPRAAAEGDPEPGHRAAVPADAGRWGEMTLRNAVEAAGMVEHCDFDEQQSTTTDGRPAAPRHDRAPAGRG